MPTIEEERKVRHLPVHGGFYHFHHPIHRGFIVRSSIDDDLRNEIKIISREMKEQRNDSNKALFSTLLTFILASYIENRITFTVENKINEQLTELFR